MPLTAINRSTILLLTNKSGGSVAYGDVVIITTTNASAFDTTTVSQYVDSTVGVVIEPNGIANNAIGSVVIAGYCPKVKLDAVATIGQVFHTDNTVKLAHAHDAPYVAGDFGIVLTASATPEAYLFGTVTQALVSTGAPDTGWTIIDTGSATPQKTLDLSSYTMDQLAAFCATIVESLITKGIFSV